MASHAASAGGAGTGPGRAGWLGGLVAQAIVSAMAIRAAVAVAMLRQRMW